MNVPFGNEYFLLRKSIWLRSAPPDPALSQSERLGSNLSLEKRDTDNERSLRERVPLLLRKRIPFVRGYFEDSLLVEQPFSLLQ